MAGVLGVGVDRGGRSRIQRYREVAKLVGLDRKNALDRRIARRRGLRFGSAKHVRNFVDQLHYLAGFLNEASQSITFGALGNQSLSSSPTFTVSASATSGLTVSFSSRTTTTCNVSGVTVTLRAVGTCTIQATQTGNATYSAATPVNQSFQVTP